MPNNCNAVTLIAERLDFYRKIYRNIKLINIFLLMVIILLGLFLYNQKKTIALPKYFPTTTDGVIIKSPPYNVNHLLMENFHFNANDELIEYPAIKKSNLDLTAPNSNEHAIITYWATTTVLTMFDIDFVNYHKVFQNIRKYFTPGGYAKFLTAFYDSKNLETIVTGKRIAFATLNGKAAITKSGIIEHRLVWYVNVPITITYANDSKEQLSQSLIAQMKIARVSTLESPFFGLAIYQINFKVSE